MARLASQEKLGYYETPEKIVRQIKTGFEIDAHTRFLDPCCADGKALQTLSDGIEGVETLGVELEKSRYEKASSVLSNVIWADALTEVKNSSRMVDLLFLNPPYDNGFRGERLELEFLRAYHTSLALNGVLVFIIPQRTLWHVKNFLSQYYGNLEIYRFPDDEFERFKQIVVIGRRKYLTSKTIEKNVERLTLISNLHIEGDIKSLPTTANMTDPFNRRRIQVLKKSPNTYKFIGNHIEPDELLPLTVSLKDSFDKHISVPDFQSIEPVMPLKKGHLAMLLAAGLVNGEVKHNGHDLVVKGTVSVVNETAEDETDEEEITTIKTKSVTTITLLDMSTGEIVEIK